VANHWNTISPESRFKIPDVILNGNRKPIDGFIYENACASPSTLLIFENKATVGERRDYIGAVIIHGCYQ
jgi:hypothetical protein